MPDLPSLPELPEIEEETDFSPEISQLPSFPKNASGEKFSEYSLKRAVAGEKEGEGVKAEGSKKGIQMTPIPRLEEEESLDNRKFTKDISPDKEIPLVREEHPIFVRMDKFEESSLNFEAIKKQINGIEKMFEDLKKVKEKEDKEVISFEEEIRKVKERVDQIDKSVFSKL